MLGKIEGRRRRGWQRMRWLDSIIDSIDMSLSKIPEIVKDREAWHAAVHGVSKSRTWLSDETTTKKDESWRMKVDYYRLHQVVNSVAGAVQMWFHCRNKLRHPLVPGMQVSSGKSFLFFLFVNKGPQHWLFSAGKIRKTSALSYLKDMSTV